MIGVNIVAGFCNRIFQMVFAYCFAKQHGIQFRIENWQQRNHHSPQIYEWLVERFTKQPNYCHNDVSYSHEFKEPGDQFMDHIDIIQYIPDPTKNDIIMYGFFQNENYFKPYQNDIINLLKEPIHITQRIESLYTSVLPLLDSAYFLHVRLGDYLGLPKHWIHLENYYDQALKYIPNDAPIFVFSNFPKDIPKFYPKLLSERKYYIVHDPDELVHFYLMIRCKKGGICANSTFGWWAGWLNTNPEKQIYMPSKWINGITETNIYPEGAIIIDV